MLEHLQKRITLTLSQSETAYLSTCGPFGVQAGEYPCQQYALRLYLLVPATLDILENVACCPEVLVVAPLWQVRGTARVVSPTGELAGMPLLAHKQFAWSSLVEICPRRAQLKPFAVWDSEETIDFDEEKDEIK